MSLGRTWRLEPFVKAKAPKSVPNGRDQPFMGSGPRDMIITGSVIIMETPNNADKVRNRSRREDGKHAGPSYPHISVIRIRENGRVQQAKEPYPGQPES